MKVIVTGLTEEEVEKRIKKMGSGWNKVAPIRPHPDRWVTGNGSAFVCVVENKKPKQKWGRIF